MVIQKMKQALLSIFIILTIGTAFGQNVLLKPADFYDLKLEEHQWECCAYIFENGSSRRLNDTISLRQLKKEDVSKSCKLTVKVSRFEYDTLNNEVTLEGFINGGWYGNSSAVEIFVGDSYGKLDTVGPPANLNIKRDKNSNGIWPVFTINTKKMTPSYFSKTPDAQQEDSRNRPFLISFKIKENDIIVFGLRPCIAEVYEIGKIIKQPPTP